MRGPNRLKAAPAFPGLHRIVIRAERLDDVVARAALKRMQVGTQKCRRASSGPGTSDRQDALGSERNDGRQGLRFCHNASFERRRVQHPGSSVPVQRAELQPSGCPCAVQYCSVSENCFLLFSGLPLSLFPFITLRRFICKKGPRGFRRRSKAGRKRPGRAATAGTIADLVLQIKKPRALTGLNLCSRFFCSRYIHG